MNEPMNRNLRRAIPPNDESTTYHIVALQELGGHGVAQFHLAVERVLLVVTDELHQTLEVGGGPQHEVPAVPVDATMLHLAPGPGGGRPQGADTPRSWQPGNGDTTHNPHPLETT